jgi:succinate dehydrogenase / fumarate reductase, cytochrome b subunit
MNTFLHSTIGKKLLMSLSGLFLISFLLIHLSVNSLLLVPVFNPADNGDAFNLAAHFMATNPVIKIIEPVLAIGFILHIVYSIVITLHNYNSRPVKYSTVNQKEASSWASRNMFILGGLIFAFLVLHIANFFWHMRFDTGVISPKVIGGEEVENAYDLITEKFSFWWLSILYVIAAVFLGLHIAHGFWSAFQTLGWSGDIWRKRLNRVGLFFAILFGGGFAAIPVVILVTSIFS